jgi:hypothetical protein
LSQGKIKSCPQQPVYKKKQADGQVYSLALNLDRFLWTGVFEDCISDRMTEWGKKRENRISDRF